METLCAITTYKAKHKIVNVTNLALVSSALVHTRRSIKRCKKVKQDKKKCEEKDKYNNYASRQFSSLMFHSGQVVRTGQEFKKLVLAYIVLRRHPEGKGLCPVHDGSVKISPASFPTLDRYKS